MRLRLSFLALLGLVACAPAAPGTRSPRAERAAPEREAVPAPWVVRNRGVHRSQELRLHAILTSVLDTLVRVDTVESALVVAWSQVPDAVPQRFAGMVTDFHVRVGDDSLHRTPGGVTLPFSFVAVADVAGAQPTITSPDAMGCASANAAVVQGWRELWMDLPSLLRPGSTWADSSAYALCRDGIPLRMSVHRRFEALEAKVRDGRPVVVVARRSEVVLAGEGLQLGELVALSGTGSGVAVLEVALDGGAVLAGEGTAELDLELRGRRRLQLLRQETRLEIRAR